MCIIFNWYVFLWTDGKLCLLSALCSVACSLLQCYSIPVFPPSWAYSEVFSPLKSFARNPGVSGLEIYQLIFLSPVTSRTDQLTANHQQICPGKTNIPIGLI